MSRLVITITTAPSFLPELEYIGIPFLIVPRQEPTDQEWVIIIIALIIIIDKWVFIHKVVWHLLQVIGHPQFVLPLLLLGLYFGGRVHLVATLELEKAS